MTRRTFEELRGEGAGWCASLAYWLGSYRGALDSQTIVEIAGVMSFQYDFEEQADAYGAALPEEQSWTAAFAPIAPVQLAAGWSPIPTAVEVLGEPVVEVAVADDATGIRLAAAAWDAVAVAAVTTTTRRSAHADDKSFSVCSRSA